MIWPQKLWARILRQPNEAVAPLSDKADAVQVAARTELERVLGIWTRWWERNESDGSDEQLASSVRRMDAALRTFLGQQALLRVRAASDPCGGRGRSLLAGDRLLVAFLGRRAAMAVTRKVYSNLR